MSEPVFSRGYMVRQVSRGMPRGADYYLGRVYAWGTGTKTRVIGYGPDGVKLAGRPGLVTEGQFKAWVIDGTLREQ